MRSSRQRPGPGHGHGERRRVALRVRALLEDAGTVDGMGDTHGAQPVREDPRPVRSAWLPGPRLDAVRPPPLAPATRVGGLRWQPDRRALTAVALAVVVAGLITAWWVLSSRPRDVAVHASNAAAGAGLTSPGESPPPTGTPTEPVTGSSTAPSPSGSTLASRLVVDVAGKVRNPGVYELAPGARVIDALQAAGGPRRGASTTSLNLAAPLHDGEQVVVGLPGAAAADMSGATGAGAGSDATGPVDLNTATFAQLQTLPGVGPVLAQRILDWRADHGRFNTVDQLDEVSGIGTVKFAQLRDRVTV